jgi:signal transduction histidine kinase
VQSATYVGGDRRAHATQRRPGTCWYTAAIASFSAVFLAVSGVTIFSTASGMPWAFAGSAVLTMYAVAAMAEIYAARATGEARLAGPGSTLLVMAVLLAAASTFDPLRQVVSWPAPLLPAVALPVVLALVATPFQPAVVASRRWWRALAVAVGATASVYLVGKSVFAGNVEISLVGSVKGRTSAMLWLIAATMFAIFILYVAVWWNGGGSSLIDLAIVPFGIGASSAAAALTGTFGSLLVIAPTLCAGTACAFGSVRQLVVRERFERHRVLDALAMARESTVRSRSIEETTEDLKHETRAGLLGIEAAWRNVLDHRRDLPNETIDQLAAGVLSEFDRLRDLLTTADPPSNACEFSLYDAITGVANLSGVGSRNLVVDVPPTLRAVGHPDRVAQIFRVLLSNIERHAPAASVLAHAVQFSDQICLWVADDGPGIPFDLAEVVFDRGRSVGPNAGTGLGLSIARSLAESEGGSLRLLRGHSSGATFELRLPAACAVRHATPIEAG